MAAAVIVVALLRRLLAREVGCVRRLRRLLCCRSSTATADPNNEYLSDGLTESLIGTLSQLPNIKVMARSTVFRFKGKEDDPRTDWRDA